MSKHQLDNSDDESKPDYTGLEADNQDIIDDISGIDLSKITVYSRDWTVETINSQISNGNIDLNPSFQRRNAWNDARRSKLIESLIVGYPIPEIVLAESSKEQGAFIVIDGKQRLLTIASFINNEKFKYWNNDYLINLNVRPDLNDKSYNDIMTNSELLKERRLLNNSAIRCTIISNYVKDDVLYDIFHRLNTGSVPLSTQELRQVLKRGPFADYLIRITNNKQNIHSVMGLKGPDNRLRDVEIILRTIALYLFGRKYNGNLKEFLDYSMDIINSKWNEYSDKVDNIYGYFNKAIEDLAKIFNGYMNVGRKFKDGKIERRFNRALFEVEVYYFMQADADNLNNLNEPMFLDLFKNICDNPVFRKSIESTTKSVESYDTRFSYFDEIFRDSFGIDDIHNPFRFIK